MIISVGNRFYQCPSIKLVGRTAGPRKGNITVADVPHEDAAEQDWPPVSAPGIGVIWIGTSVLVGFAGALGEVDPLPVERARVPSGEVHAEVGLRNPCGGLAWSRLTFEGPASSLVAPSLKNT